MVLKDFRLPRAECVFLVVAGHWMAEGSWNRSARHHAGNSRRARRFQVRSAPESCRPLRRAPARRQREVSLDAAICLSCRSGPVLDAFDLPPPTGTYDRLSMVAEHLSPAIFELK